MLLTGCAYQLPQIITMLSGCPLRGVLTSCHTEKPYQLPHRKTVLSGGPHMDTVLSGGALERVCLTHGYSAERVLLRGCAFQLPHTNTALVRLPVATRGYCAERALLRGCAYQHTRSAERVLLSLCANQLPHMETLLSGCS